MSKLIVETVDVDPSIIITKTDCCGAQLKGVGRPPVQYNQWNGVIQCHNCGTIYGPKEKS